MISTGLRLEAQLRRAFACLAVAGWFLSGLAAATPVSGAPDDAGFVIASSRSSPWAVSFGAGAREGVPLAAPAKHLAVRFVPEQSAEPTRQGPAGRSAATDDQETARATAFVYSEGYGTRRKIHFIASFATIPLFAAQYALGRKLYDGTGSGSTRTAHRAVAVGVGALFGVNTVTGVWNLVEARHDPNGRTKRTLHGVLMLAADAGFVATAALAPGTDGSGNRSAHRTMAITSVAVATTGYLVMVLSR